MDQSSSENQDEKQVRSYECTFCKKGFTNAQALGGHMNSHRKDKAMARMKQSSTEQTSKKSLDVHTARPVDPTINSTSSIESNAASAPSETQSSKLKRTATWPCITSSEERKSPEGEGETARPTNNQVIGTSPEKSPTGQESKSAGLDLELRLGNQPPTTADTTRTRKFF